MLIEVVVVVVMVGYGWGGVGEGGHLESCVWSMLDRDFERVRGVAEGKHVCKPLSLAS